jgi:peptidoglycan/LPS O-acetylase OafA/YrhL
MKRIPSLDGFRAISIILVVFSHCRFLNGFPLGLIDFARQCDVGVIIFFVISGYLITTLLLHEFKRTNNVNIKSFYIRRAVRIAPIFFLYIIVIMSYNNVLNLNITKSNLLHALTFTANFDFDPNWFLGHFWTLSIEEQFYLFWPLIFLLFKKRIKTAIIFLIIYSWLIRVLVYKFHLNETLFLYHFFFKSDSILIGCLAAIIHFEHPKIIKTKIFHNYYIQCLALCLIISFVYASAHGKLAIIALPFGITIISLATIFLILCFVNYKNNIIYKLLNSKILVHIGILSYSIYGSSSFFTKVVNQ